MFTQNGDIQSAVENTLNLNPGALDATIWQGVINAANNWAWQEIVGRLSARGFSAGQIQSWDNGFFYQRSLGIFHALNHRQAMVASDEFSRITLKEFDLRSQLSGDYNANPRVEAVMLTAAGVVLDPVLSYGQVICQPMVTAYDMFVPFDLCDPRIGHPMRM